MSDFGIWRNPYEESIGLYPGLVVHDGRQSGSITVGQSRLPLWAMVGDSFWEDVIADYGAGQYGLTEQALKNFIFNVLDLRGEFARLLLILADCERAGHVRYSKNPWWRQKRRSKLVADQLQRCLATLTTTPYAALSEETKANG